MKIDIKSLLIGIMFASAVRSLFEYSIHEVKAQTGPQFEIVSSASVQDAKIANPILANICTLYTLKNRENGKKYILAANQNGIGITGAE